MFSFQKLSQIKQIIEHMIKFHLMIRKIVKKNIKNLMNIKMAAVQSKSFPKQNSKF